MPRPARTPSRRPMRPLPGHGRGRGPILLWVLASLLVAGVIPPPAPAGPGPVRSGAPSMSAPAAPPFLLTSFETYLREQDLEAFRRDVSARYTEGTLARLTESPEVRARRAATLALGLIGSYQVNATVARGLRDEDGVVRDLAKAALWSIWFRADTPANNAMLEQVRDLINRRLYAEAEDLAARLIGRAPTFAEAYNQRAIARFLSNRFADSSADCRRTLDRNPYHIGALGGLGQCYLKLDRREEALATFRRALKLQPFEDGLREAVAALEAAE